MTKEKHLTAITPSISLLHRWRKNLNRKCSDCSCSLARYLPYVNQAVSKKRCQTCVMKSDIKYTKRIINYYGSNDGDGITIEQIYAKPGIDINKIRLHHIAHWELYHHSPYKGYADDFNAIHDWNEVWTGMTAYFIDLCLKNTSNRVTRNQALKEDCKLTDIRKDKRFIGRVKRGYMQYGGNNMHAIVQIYGTDEIFYVHGGWS